MINNQFYPLLAHGADYPRAKVSILPRPSLAAWLDRRGLAENSAFLRGGESFTHSRYALAEALRRAGVAPGKSVLLPAYHCRSIVEPVLYHGAQPVFYPMQNDLRPDMPALLNLAERHDCAALVLTHYFGFENATVEVKRLCDALNIAMIEDCAHRLYGENSGTAGAYAVASLWKFLPIQDGAVLLDSVRTQLAPARQSWPWRVEFKSALRWLMQDLRQRNCANPPAVNVSEVMQQAVKIASSPVQHIPKQGLQEFDIDRAGHAALRGSRWMARTVSHGRVIRKRRAHYQRWLDAVRDLPVVHPLYPELPAHVAPYAFPLLVDHEGLLFHAFKLAGIPMWRWEDMAHSECAIAQDYRQRLVQLPCHQELTEAQMDWLLHTVRDLARALA